MLYETMWPMDSMFICKCFWAQKSQFDTFHISLLWYSCFPDHGVTHGKFCRKEGGNHRSRIRTAGDMPLLGGLCSYVVEILSHLVVMFAAWYSTAYVIPVYLLLHFLIATQVTDLSVRQLLEAPLLWLFPSSRLVSSRPRAARSTRLCSWLLRLAMMVCSSWTTAMIPWKNSIQNKFATRLQATAAKGCRPGCKHSVTRRGGEAAAPPAWRVATSTAAASRRCRGSVEATATARVETAPGGFTEVATDLVRCNDVCCSMFGFCCHRTPGSGHLLLQAAGSGAGSGAGQRRRVAGTFLVGGRAAVFWNGCSMAQESILYRKDHCAILPRCCARHEWCCSIYSDRQLHFCRSFGHDFFRVAVSATFPGGNLEALECDLRVAEN